MYASNIQGFAHKLCNIHVQQYSRIFYQYWRLVFVWSYHLMHCSLYGPPFFINCVLCNQWSVYCMTIVLWNECIQQCMCTVLLLIQHCVMWCFITVMTHGCTWNMGCNMWNITPTIPFHQSGQRYLTIQTEYQNHRNPPELLYSQIFIFEIFFSNCHYLREILPLCVWCVSVCACKCSNALFVWCVQCL